MNNIILEANNLHKWYGSIHALKGVDFSVYEGEILGLLGGNGAGKSTLINILSGVYKKDEGEIILRNKEINFNSPQEARNSGIETVFQDQALVNDLNIAQNIFLSREITNKFGFVKDSIMEKESANLIKSLGLNIPNMQKEVQYCSGGERQGIALSRAIYFKAKIVLLDEPMTALSAEGKNRMYDIIQKMRIEEKISFLIISHDIEKIYSLCDRFLIFNRGEKKVEINKNEITIKEIEKTMLQEGI
jgi:ABC-type sugar transport system ATPase subunit